jgi:hypothetical protein
VWFGGGWSPKQDCIAGPLVARFVRYGTRGGAESGHVRKKGGITLRAGKAALNTLALPSNETDLRVMTHIVHGLTSHTVSAATSGPHGLLVAHFKPQSIEEWRSRYAWNQYQQRKFPVGARATGHFKTGKSRGNVFESVDAPWHALRNATTDATHAFMHFRLPSLCHRSARFAAAMASCGMERLCDDCDSLQAAYRCLPSAVRERTPRSRPGPANTTRLVVLGRRHAAAVVLAALRALPREDPARGPAIRARAQSRAGDADARARFILPDAADRAAVCSADCSRTLLVDIATLGNDLPTIGSLAAIWAGLGWDRLPRRFPVDTRLEAVAANALRNRAERISGRKARRQAQRRKVLAGVRP